MITHKAIYRTFGLFLTLIVLISGAAICTGKVTAAGGNVAIIPSVDEITIELPKKTSETVADNLSSSPELKALSGVLSGTVYILNDGSVVEDIPPITDVFTSSAKRNSRMTEPPASAQVAAQFTVIPTRIIVVDESDELLEIWNNTHTGDSFYCLKTKVFSGHGAEHPLTPQIVAQYNSLMADIDWSMQGRVYPRNPY
jgi:hypothetical protein